METHDQPKSEPELVQISVDGQPYFAFKWWDQQQVDGRDVRYVVKDPTCDVISYMLIICANRVPRETDLVAMKFYAVEKPNESGYWPAETTWTSGDVDIGSAVRICSPKETYQEYRGLPRDIEYLIREYKEGRLQLRQPGKKDVTLEMVHAKVIDIGKDTSSLLDTAAENKQRIETLCLNTDAMAKNEYALRQENAELQRLQADGYLKFAAKVNGGDFTALIYIMALGNRKKAANSLGVPLRTFYDKVDNWRNLGPEYRRMFRLVEWRKNVGRQLKVRLEDSLLSGEPNGREENPETIRDVMTRMKDQEVDSRDYPAILSDILDAMSKQNPANWRTVNKEVIGIITEELPQ